VFAPGPANIDARLLDHSDDALISTFRNISLQSDELPLRPGFGTAGKSIKLRANFFPVKVPKIPLFEYTVSISPTTTIRRVKRRIFQLAEETPDWKRHGLKGNVAHDHAQKLIAAKKLPQPLTIRVPFFDEDEDGPKEGGKEYTLTIEFSGNLDMQNLHKCVACE
jgi:eukaryotic translation initiation factor 2C